ncbi:MAG: hypothetical protein ACR2PF_07050, partial [Rhizobiaceae bacterium]
PYQRLERGRERAAFFRQTSIFWVAALTMLVFVPLAMWQKPWALPFLGWMIVVPGLMTLIWGMAAEALGLDLGFEITTLVMAPFSILAFLALAWMYYPAVLLFGIGIALLAIGALIYSWIVT